MRKTLSAAAILVCVLATSTLAQPEPVKRSINVSGEAVIYVTPDEVVVSLGVETHQANLDESKAENDEKSKKLVAAIKELGIDEKNLHTSAMVVAIVYEDTRYVNRAHKIIGYTCRRSYDVKLTDLKLLETLVNTSLNSGANQLTGIAFRTSELRKHRDDARVRAVTAAREKAEAMAGVLNCRIGAPINIQEVTASPYDYRALNFAAQVAVPAGADSGEASGETLPSGQMDVRASVNITFEIIPL